MSEIKVSEIDKNEYALWDELVECSPHGTIFHSTDWLTMCSEASNRNLKIFGCFENDILVGGCSLFVHNLKGDFKVASSTCSMTPYGGVVLEQESNNMGRRQLHRHQNLIKHLYEALYKEKFHSVQITNPPEFLDIRPFTWNGWDCEIKYAYYMNLEKDIEKNLSKGVKENIKKALKKGIQTERRMDVKRHYELSKMIYEKQGLKPPVNEEFFENVVNLLKSKNIGEMMVSETSEGEIVASNIVLWDKKKAYGWSAASDPAFRKLGANVLQIQELFKYLKNQGFKNIDCMSANTPRLTEFIVGFHPTLIPYYRIGKEGHKYRLVKNIYQTYKKIGFK